MVCSGKMYSVEIALVVVALFVKLLIDELRRRPAA